MKTSFFIGILTVAITLIPNISTANSDDNDYPATNFQPKIIYQDKEAIGIQGGEKPAYDPKYPATYFQPKIIFQDKTAIKTLASATSLGEKSVYDPKYPAANFQPKVIYP